MKAGTKAVATETKTADDEDESTQEDYVILLKTTFFIMIACPGHILKSTKGVEIKLSL